jgi:hypothetical protein
MATNYATDNSNMPGPQWTQANGFLYLVSGTDTYGILPSTLQIGGYQELATLNDRDAIPVSTTAGQLLDPDGIGSGRRRIGMTVKVFDPEGNGQVESKTYCLMPYGYFGNEGQLSISDWNSLSEAERVVLLDPTATVSGGLGQPDITGSGNPDDCWVELIQFTEHPLPSGGSAGELLAKIDSDDHNVGWVSPTALQGPPGADGLNGSVEASWIGNMFTHPNFPGADGISGLMTEGDVNVAVGDIFSINLYGDDEAPSELNGTFIATEDFIMPQATSGATALFNILAKWNFTFETFSQAILPIKTTTQEFTITISTNNKFEINGVEQDTLTLVRGLTYYFNTSSIDTNTHPFALSATEDGSHNGGGLYTLGLEYSPAGSLSFIFNTSDLTIDTLYYYCANHVGMGGTINVINPANYSNADVTTFLNGNLDGHIIPDTNAAYDLGSAEYKIRHLYLSDNSLTMGDTLLNEQKILNTLNFNIDPNIPAPATQSEPGIKGDIRFDLNYMYICVEQDTWRRIALDSGWSV